MLAIPAAPGIVKRRILRAANIRVIASKRVVSTNATSLGAYADDMIAEPCGVFGRDDSSPQWECLELACIGTESGSAARSVRRRQLASSWMKSAYSRLVRFSHISIIWHDQPVIK
jgi:hypothetical protein